MWNVKFNFYTLLVFCSLGIFMFPNKTFAQSAVPLISSSKTSISAHGGETLTIQVSSTSATPQFLNSTNNIVSCQTATPVPDALQTYSFTCSTQKAYGMNDSKGKKVIAKTGTKAVAAFKAPYVWRGKTFYKSLSVTLDVNYSPPTITSITPSMLPACLGTPITIVGTNFASDADVLGLPLMDGEACKVVNSTKIECQISNFILDKKGVKVPIQGQTTVTVSVKNELEGVTSATTNSKGARLPEVQVSLFGQSEASCRGEQEEATITPPANISLDAPTITKISSKDSSGCPNQGSFTIEGKNFTDALFDSSNWFPSKINQFYCEIENDTKINCTPPSSAALSLSKPAVYSLRLYKTVISGSTKKTVYGNLASNIYTLYVAPPQGCAILEEVREQACEENQIRVDGQCIAKADCQNSSLLKISNDRQSTFCECKNGGLFYGSSCSTSCPAGSQYSLAQNSCLCGASYHSQASTGLCIAKKSCGSHGVSILELGNNFATCDCNEGWAGDTCNITACADRKALNYEQAGQCIYVKNQNVDLNLEIGGTNSNIGSINVFNYDNLLSTQKIIFAQDSIPSATLTCSTDEPSNPAWIAANMIPELSSFTSELDFSAPQQQAILNISADSSLSEESFEERCSAINTGAPKCSLEFSDSSNKTGLKTTSVSLAFSLSQSLKDKCAPCAEGFHKEYDNFTCVPDAPLECPEGQIEQNRKCVDDPNFIIAKLTGGALHTCAILTTGDLKCWGDNTYGQIGDGTTTTALDPTPSDLNSYYYTMGVGYYHTCGITTNGKIRCWGQNYGQNPVFVDNEDTRYDQIAAGQSRTCAITTSGTLKCWEQNPYPVIKDQNSTYKAIAAGWLHMCGITTAGVLKCWGSNYRGVLGTGVGLYENNPTVVDAGTQYEQITANAWHTCGTTTEGKIKCWGHNSDHGQVGDGTYIDRALPVLVDSNTNYYMIASGQYHTCAITEAGKVKCWGYNGQGQLGDGTWTSKNVPTLIDPNTTYTRIEAGGLHTCGITSSGMLKCWGYNGNGQLGIPDKISRNIPTPVNMNLQESSGGRATSVRWATSASGTSLTSLWTPNSSENIKNQKIVFFSGATCTNSMDLNDPNKQVGSAIELSKTDSTYLFTGEKGETYSFMVVTNFLDGTLTTSTCSGGKLIPGPTSPSTLTWANGAGDQSGSSPLIAQWTNTLPSTHTVQKIQLYTNETCTIPSGENITLTKTATTYDFTSSIQRGAVFAYKIIRSDEDTTRTSPCSASVSFPQNPRAYELGFSRTQPTELKVSWKNDLLKDIGSQELILYCDDTCSTQCAEMGFSVNTVTIAKENLDEYMTQVIDLSPFQDLQKLTFKLNTLDEVNDSVITSACSEPFTLSFPNPATDLNINLGEYIYDDASRDISFTWNPGSSSIGIANEYVEVYQPGCIASYGQVSVIGAGSYSARVVTENNDGLLTYSQCIDFSVTIPQTSARGLTITDNAREIRDGENIWLSFYWTPALGGDSGWLSERIILYESGSNCSDANYQKADIEPAHAGAGGFYAAPGFSYQFKIVSTNGNGEDVESTCSESIFLSP